MSIEVIDNYCESCGTKYTFQKERKSVFVRGDWFGHHPDHYETYEEDNLRSTPCPNCGSINERHITLKKLEDVVIKGMTVEEKYKCILSEKENNNLKKIKKLNEEISIIHELLNIVKRESRIF